MVGCLRKTHVFFTKKVLNKCSRDEGMDGSIICIGLAEIQLFEKKMDSMLTIPPVISF